MAIYLLADLHLSLDSKTNKSMEVFGPKWQGYTKRIEDNWKKIVEDKDTVVIPGDISWAMTLDGALPDLAFIDSLPGKKILMKGNHDFWWTSQAKMNAFFEKHHLSTLSILYHDARIVEDVILTGTRGWFYDQKEKVSPDEIEKIVARESIRLKMALDAAKKLKEENDFPIVACFHFPPYFDETPCELFTNQLEEAGVSLCYYGHIHSMYNLCVKQIYHNIPYICVSSDFVSFVPQLLKIYDK